MKTLALLLSLSLMLTLASAYDIGMSREELLEGYYEQVSDKIPKSARFLLGDERINVYIGASVIGIETKNGELRTLETRALERASITIIVSDEAAQKIEDGKIGVLSAMEGGGIKVKTSNIFSSFKVEALKKVYSVSGYDKMITSKGAKDSSSQTTSSMYPPIPRARIVNALAFGLG